MCLNRLVACLGRLGSRQVALRPLLMLMCLVVALAVPRSAQAYPWMIRHAYAACATCHVDPSGAGVLTAYGAAQGDALLRTHYGAPSASGEASRSAGFLWGAVDPPDWFLPSGSIRTLAVASKYGSRAFATDFIIMQADLKAAVVKGGFRAYGSVGYVSSSGSAASLSGGIVSREHWLGWAFGDDAFLLRAGRIDLPFGIRQIEHTLFVRQSTRTDLNDTQQHGVAISYTGELVRAEIMAIAGNYQVSPDAYRERGYSAYAEITPVYNLAFGVSSLVTHAARDLYLRLPTTRQAHGLFGRWAPVQPLALLAEADLVAQSATSATGYATMLQADVEPFQGLHLIATGENMRLGGTNSGISWSGWLGAGWFFAPHLDARFDFQKQSLALGANHLAATALLFQFHAYL